MPRRRKPTEQKKTEGTWRPDRANPLEPAVAPGEPERPDHLHKYAVEVWEKTVPILLRRRVLTVADGAALAGFCTAVARVRQCEEEIEERGLTYLAPTGLWKENPALGAQLKWLKEVGQGAARFGLSPADLSRVSELPAGDEVDPMDELVPPN